MTALIVEAIEHPLHPGPVCGIARLCEAVDLPRATFYRHRTAPPWVDPDMELRDRIQRIALEWPAYGYRRITEELDRQGHRVNHKRVLRLLREDNLLCLRKKRFITTTDSTHGYGVYPNRVPSLTVSGIDQLWVADLTYIRLLREFLYLSVILDAYSRRVLGWSLDRTLEARGPLAALQGALSSRTVKPGLVHHSDRGVQYACHEYTGLLRSEGIEISMSRKGNPYDNAKAESFMKTLKAEEVYLSEYEDFGDAHHSIGHFLEAVYNRRRLHSALGYRPPVEFEESLIKANGSPGESTAAAASPQHQGATKPPLLTDP